MLVKMVCPQCGAQLELDESGDSMFCQFCGTKVENVAQKYEIQQDVNVSGTVVHKEDNTNKPNLFINYTTINAAVGMVVRVVATGVKNYYINGQTFSYHMAPGWNDLVIKIGKKNYARKIYINENNDPVRIYASWNGRGQISIDQPPVPMTSYAPINPQPQNYPAVPQGGTPVNNASGGTYVNAASARGRSWMSIVGFVCAMTMIGFFPGIVFSILDLAIEKDRPHGLSIAGLVVSTVFLLVWLFGRLN